MIVPSPLPALIAARYRPIRLIATGGMGAVYEVEHISTGARLALKVLLSNPNASPEAVARFQHEVRATARIRSDNVVRVTDADVAPELGGAPFLVMELLEGTDLERAAVANPPAPATVIEWLRPVARAIDKAHRLGLVHRDLKPENLFLTAPNDGPASVKILDFGIVKMIEEGTGATGTGQILGTPKYMAPEQASTNAEITPATDRCALGLIAYRLLMGESYYRGGVMVILGELLHGQLQPPSERGSRLGDAFDHWFLKACHRVPERRFASASEQIEALAVALGLATVPLEALRTTSSRFSWRPSKRGVLPILVAAVVVTSALVAVRFRPRHAITPKHDQAVVCGLPDRGATSACGPCIARACCQEVQACAGADGCPQTDDCVHDCDPGDVGCRSRCFARERSGAQVQQRLETCRATSCATECLPAPWACLGHVKGYSRSAIPPRIIVKTRAICYGCGTGGGPAPLGDTMVRICSLADPKCALPLAHGKTDDSGAVTLNVDTSLYPPPLSVFLEYTKDGYLDLLVQMSGTSPLSADVSLNNIPLVDLRSQIAPTALRFGTTYDPTRAYMDVRPLDCNGQLATKKTTVTWLDRDDKTVSVPFFPYSSGATAVNLPINTANVTRVVARVSETNQLIGTATALVRPRAVTYLELAPTP